MRTRRVRRRGTATGGSQVNALKVLIAACAITLTIGVGSALAGGWVPGQPAYITEAHAESYQERGPVELAICKGMPQYGNNGRGGFVAFNCMIKFKDGFICFNQKAKAVKAHRRGAIRMESIGAFSMKDCT